MAKVTIDDVAARAGVSIKTVSRVVNREPNVRQSTRDKVDDAIRALNYRPNQFARNLASRRSHLIGLLYDDPGMYEVPSSGYVVSMQQGLLAACRELNYELLIHPCNFRDNNVGQEIHDMVDHRRIDGIVLAAPLSNMKSIVSAIDSTNIPYVRMSPGPDSSPIYTVRTNDREICREMTAYLASLGHGHIAFIAGNPEHKAVAERKAGYLDGLKSAGLPVRKSLVAQGDNSIGSGERCAEKLLSSKRPPTAIFAANDDMAAGVLRVAHRRDIDVPGTLSVCGFDDIPLAQQIFPALTTVRQPLEEMARHAAVMLVDHLRSDTDQGEAEVIPASLVIRESTGPARV